MRKAERMNASLIRSPGPSIAASRHSHSHSWSAAGRAQTLRSWTKRRGVRAVLAPRLNPKMNTWSPFRYLSVSHRYARRTAADSPRPRPPPETYSNALVPTPWS